MTLRLQIEALCVNFATLIIWEVRLQSLNLIWGINFVPPFSSSPSTHLLLLSSFYSWLPDEDMTKSKGKDPLEGLGGLWQGLEKEKQRKLFNKCRPYYLNTSPSFKEKSPRLWVVSWPKCRRTKWRHFISILECLVCQTMHTIKKNHLLPIWV